jgi:hypothetical protein
MKKNKSNFPYILKIPKDVVVKGAITLKVEDKYYETRRVVDKEKCEYTQLPEPWNKKP